MVVGSTTDGGGIDVPKLSSDAEKEELVHVADGGIWEMKQIKGRTIKVLNRIWEIRAAIDKSV